MKVTFNTRAVFSGELLSTEVVLPAVSARAAEPPVAAQLPSSLGTRRECLKGLGFMVADLDMMVWGGFLDCICLLLIKVKVK
jgi:hypothetical protein